MKQRCNRCKRKLFMIWIAEWITTGHNIWKCSNCGNEQSFDNEIDNPNKF